MTPQPANPPLLLRNARVYAPQPLGICDLLLVEGRILAVDASIEITGLPGLHEMDAQGAVVSPGLVDTLTHITGGGGEGGYGSRMPAMPPEDAWLSGVTTVTGALGTDAVQRSHSELLAHARLLGAAGVSACIYAGNYHLPIRTLTGSVQTDLAWIPEVIGVGEVAIADHRGSHPSAAELARLASEVRVGAMLGGKQGVLSIHVGDHDAGLNVLFEAAANYPVRLSHFYPTHINRTRDLLQQGCRFAREGGTIDFTATTNAGLLAAGDVDSPVAVAEALAAGVPGERITLSSDAYASLPEFDAEGRFLRVGMGRLDSLADAVQRGVRDVGLSFETLLRTVSLNPAETLGLPRKGRLEVGADADLVLWSEHHEVLGVISGGVVRRWPD